MKTLQQLSLFLLIQFLLSGFASAQNPVAEGCSYEGIPLYGNVKIVESFPDFTVKFVDSFPDFTVQFVESFPGRN